MWTSDGLHRRDVLRASLLAGAGVCLTGGPLSSAFAAFPPGSNQSPLGPLQPALRAGELAFAVADARDASGTIAGKADLISQTSTSLEHLRKSLQGVERGLEHVISLWVMVPDFARVNDVAELVNKQWPDPKAAPALTFIGNSALDNGCAVRLDAIASTSADRGAIIVPDVPLPPGVRVHGVFAGGVAYLSGVSAPDMQGGNQGETLYRQVGAVLDRMDLLLRSQKLGLGDLGRTWMFQRNLDVEVRAFYGKARQERYEGLFELNKFPANSGIQMPNLGDNTMIRSIGFAASNKTYVVSDKVRLSPGSFSQAVQFGDWLHICGIDAYDLKRNLESPGDLAGQTERCMEYTRFIVEAAGGKMSDIVKTTAYIINGEDREKFARPFQTYFDKHGASRIPSSAVMDVQQLSSGILVEIDSVAYLGHRDPRSNG